MSHHAHSASTPTRRLTPYISRKLWPHLFLLIAIAAGGSLVSSSRAAADDTQEGEVPPAVASLCKQALARVRKGDFEAARVLYLKAFDSTPNAGILFNLALTELNSSHPLDALRHFREYLHARGAEKETSQRVQTDLLPKAFAATGHVTIANSPDPAIYYLDGQRLLELPGNVIDVAPGHHYVGARTPDQGWTAEVDVRAGESATARLHLDWVHGGSGEGHPSVSDAGVLAPLADAGSHR